MSIKSSFVKLFLFDERKRRLFLTIVSSQLKSGIAYQDVFKIMARSSNKYYKRLAALSLNPKSEYFASGYNELFPENTAKLLTLSQRWNAVPQFIDESINSDKKSLSYFDAVIVKNIMEILLALLFTGICIALYLYNETLIETYGDFSSSILYKTGEFLYSNRWLIALLSGSTLAVYFYYKNVLDSTRWELKRTGFYHFYDANFLIELFGIIKIMTSVGIAQGGSIKTLIDELSLILGTNKLRRTQFTILRSELSKGKKFQDAIYKSKIMDNDTLDVFKGLAVNETTDEIHNASRAVTDLLIEKSRVEMGFLSKNTNFLLLLYLAIGMIAIVDITMGGGSSVLNQTT